MNGVEMMKKNDRDVADDFDDDKHQSEKRQASEESERLKNDDEDEEIDDRSSSDSTTTSSSDDDDDEEEEDWFELLADGILDGYVTLQDVQRQISAHPEWLGQTSKVTGYSLLHCACDGLYSMDIVEYLLRALQQQQQQENDASQRNDFMTGTLMDHNRWTPLHCACDNANPLTLDCVKLLLKFEEEQEQKRQSSSSTATTSASPTFGGSSQWIRARTMAGETPLFLACQSGRTAILHWQFPNTQTIRWLAEQWPLACVLKAASSSTVSGSHPDNFNMITNESGSKNDDYAVPLLERYAVRYECPLDVVEDYKEIAEGYFEASAGSAGTTTPPALRSDANHLSHSNPFYRMSNQSDDEESIDAEAYLYDVDNMDNEADEPLEQDDSKIFLSQLQDSLQANEAQVLEYFDLVEFLTNQTERVEHDLVQAAVTHGPYGCIAQRDFDELLCCSCCNNKNNHHHHSGTNLKQRSCLRQALSPEPLRQLWDTVAAMHAAGRLDAVSPNATRKHAVQVCAAVAATTAAPVATAVGVGGQHHQHNHHSRKKKTNAVVDGLWLHLRENPRLCDRQRQIGSENYNNNDAKVSKKNKAARDVHNNEADEESIRHEIKRQRLQY